MTRQRRDFLRGSGAALAASLAGCTGGGGDGAGGGTSPDGETDSPTGAEGSGGSGGSDADATVVVGPGGDLTFDPAELSVDAGATVRWEWDSGGHTVTPTDIPDGSDWQGTGSETHDSGYTHSHTFETEGEFAYVCEPHRSAGMVGTVLVGDAAAGGGTDSPTPTESGDSDGGGGYY